MKQLILFISIFLLAVSINAQPPKKAVDAYNEAVALTAQGKMYEALPFLKTATGLYPKYYQAYLKAGLTFAKLSIYGDAKFCFDKAIQIKPNYCEGYAAFGDYYKNVRQRSDSALIYYAKLIQLKCDTGGAINFNIGWCYNDQHQYDKGLAALKKSIQADSLSKNTINEISYSFKQLNKVNDGVEFFERYYKTTNIELYLYYVGMFYLELKQKDKAITVYNELQAKGSKLAASLDKKIKAYKE